MKRSKYHTLLQRRPFDYFFNSQLKRISNASKYQSYQFFIQQFKGTFRFFLFFSKYVIYTSGTVVGPDTVLGERYFRFLVQHAPTTIQVCGTPKNENGCGSYVMS